MTTETAEKAAQILKSISDLNVIRNGLLDSNYVQIYGMTKDGTNILQKDCQKGCESGKLVKIILDGIDQEIRNLQNDLKAL